jgi:hypothetical protein
MFLVAIIVDPTVQAYWFEALPAHGSKLVGTPTAATNSMPRSGFVQSTNEIARFAGLKLPIPAISNAAATEKQTPDQSLGGLFTDDYFV